MDIQQYLHDSTVGLHHRLHGAKAAFLSESGQLSTYHKEDVVIQWLTSLVKEKRAATWPEEVEQEQENVWQLLSALFSSKRLKQLVHHQWTCPVTSSFLQTTVDILGSPNLSEVTQEHIICTIHAILSTPSIARVIINSSQLSSSLCKVILTIISSCDWKDIQNQSMKEISGKSYVMKRKRSDFLYSPSIGIGTDEFCSKLSYDILLETLCILLEDVQQQMEAKGEDDDGFLNFHQLLKKIISARLSLKDYNGKLKSRTLEQLDSLVASSFFNSKALSQYKNFLEQIVIEDCKLDCQYSFINISFNILSDVMTNDDVSLVQSTFSVFFKSFIKKCECVKQQQTMLAALLCIAGVSVAKFPVDTESMAFADINLPDLPLEKQEVIVCALLSVVHDVKNQKMVNSFEDFLTSLLVLLSQEEPMTVHGMTSIQFLVSLYPLKLCDSLSAVLGTILTWDKNGQQFQAVFGKMLSDVLLAYAKVHKLGAFLVAQMRELVSNKELLDGPCEVGSSAGEQRQLLLPEDFVCGLEKAIALLEPLQHCQLLESVQNFMREQILLVTATKEEDSFISPPNGRCCANLCLLASKVLSVPLPRRTLHVHGVCGRLSAIIAGYFRGVLRPLIQNSLKANHDNNICFGLLVLWRSACQLLHSLNTSPEFQMEWTQQELSLHSEESHKAFPLWNLATWSQLESKLDQMGDEHTRLQAVMLVSQVYSYSNAEEIEGLTMRNDSPEKAGPAENTKKGSVAIATALLRLLQKWPLAPSGEAATAQHFLALVPFRHLPHEFSSHVASVVVSEYMKSGSVSTVSAIPGDVLHLHSSQIVGKTISEICNSVPSSIDESQPSKKRKRRDSESECLSDKERLCKFVQQFVGFVTSYNDCNLADAKRKKMYQDKIKETGKKFIELIAQFSGSCHFTATDQCNNLFSLLNDLPLEFINEESTSFIVIVSLILLFHSDLSASHKQNKLIFCVLKKSLMTSGHIYFMDVTDEAAILKMLLQCLFKVKKSLDIGGVSTEEQLCVILKGMLMRFITTTVNAEDGLLEVTSFLISSAKKDCEGKEKVYLRPAWIIVQSCCEYIVRNSKTAADARRRGCEKSIKSIGSWCMKLLSKIDRETACCHTALFILRIYSVVINSEGKKEASSTENGQNGEKGAVNGWGDADLNASVASDALNGTLEQEGVKAPRWQRYLSHGIELAHLCLASGDNLLASTALSFVLAVKELPFTAPIPSDLFLVSLRAFTNKPQDSEKYVGAFNEPDNASLAPSTPVTEIKDPVTNKPISFNALLVNSPIDVYEELLHELVGRSSSFNDGLFVHTMHLWPSIIGTSVGPQHQKAKRSALAVLSRTLVQHLANDSLAEVSQGDELYSGLKGSLMVSVLEVMSCIVSCPDKLPLQTVMQCIPACVASTRHLPLTHFVKVWQQQVILLENALLRREALWANTVAGLEAALQHLVKDLVLRSDQNIVLSKESVEMLTGCTLYLERLLQKLSLLAGGSLSKVAHCTLGEMVAALHHTAVVPPVKSVLEQLIYQVFKLCDPNTLSQLPVALAPDVRNLLRYYQQNYTSHYTFSSKIRTND